MGIKHYKIFGRHIMSYGWWSIHTEAGINAIHSKVLSFYKPHKTLTRTSTLFDIFLKQRITTKDGVFEMGWFKYKKINS